jgi:phospholipid/cholesterol/gamma-HCH transport system permease protein
MVDVARWLTGRVLAGFEAVGRKSVAVSEEVGYLFSLLLESLYWAFVGRWRQQPVRLAPIFAAAMAVGVTAIPIIALASFAVGTMLAIQGIYSLRAYGAESRVVLAIAISVTREFAPLITGIFVAGRSASAIAAQIGTMQVSQEIDALSVIGINPVRYLVSPLLLAMLITMPALVVMSNFIALSGGALYCNLELGMPFSAYVDSTLDALKPADVWQGLSKSFVFAAIITLVGATNGFMVKAGAEGVGKATTRAVVVSIASIILADMIFSYFQSR